MAFNKQGFIRWARSQDPPYTDEEIDAELLKHAGGLEKLLRSPVLPAGGAVLGGIAGALPSAGVMTAPGAMAGGIAGTVVQDQLLQLLGQVGIVDLPNKTPLKRLEEGANTAANAFSAGSLAELMRFAMNPGKARETYLNENPKVVPKSSTTAKLEQSGVYQPNLPAGEVATPQGGKYVGAEFPPVAQKSSGEIINKLYPQKPLGADNYGNVNLNDYYKTLGQFESENRAYDLKTPNATTAKDISISLRQLGNQLGGWPVKAMNQYMSTTSKAKPMINRMGQVILPWILLQSAVNQLGKTIKGE